jgi:demethylmenaquinone methyltransferase/2-methoxy-6-polyprenyl-1,4-benzoquinol methylase
VLDVAIGTGLVAREIQAVLGDSGGVVGIDPSPGMMTSNDNARAIACIQGRAESLPFASASFDFLSLGFALRHMADLERVFREFRRVLKPGGQFILSDCVAPEQPAHDTFMQAFELLRDQSHVRDYGIDQWIKVKTILRHGAPLSVRGLH